MKKTIYDDAYRAIISDLRYTREKRGLRQVDVARRLGVSRQWIQKAETCQLRLDIMQLMHMCRIYGIKASRILRRVAEELSDEDAPFLAIRKFAWAVWVQINGVKQIQFCWFSRFSFADFRFIPILVGAG